MTALGWILVVCAVGPMIPGAAQVVAWGITFVVVRWLWLLTRGVFRI